MTEIEITKNAYIKEGKKYARCTRVLDIIAKPEFYRWYASKGYKYCTEHRDNRAAFGTRMHKEFEHHLSGKEVKLDDAEMEQYFSLFEDWEDFHDVQPELLEHHMLNDDLMVGGTADFIGSLDGKKMLLDWKTSKRIYDTYPLQVSCYLYMYEQESGNKLDGAGIIVFNGQKCIEKYISRANCMKNLEVYRAARTLYKWKYKI